MFKCTLTCKVPFALYVKDGNTPVGIGIRTEEHVFSAVDEAGVALCAALFLKSKPPVTVRGVTRVAKAVRLVQELHIGGLLVASPNEDFEPIIFEDETDERLVSSGGLAPQATVAQRGTYSFYYNRDEAGVFALDWNWMNGKGQWAASMKETNRWDSYPETEENMRQALLNHFGLSDWTEQFSWMRIKTMSPRDLAAHRRTEERLHGLQFLEIKSDTVGYKVPADTHSS